MNRSVSNFSFSLLVSLFSLLSFQSIAQPGTTTEAEVNNQKIFIEANKEKILENYELAISLFKEVLKTDPKNHAAAYELARVYDVTDNDEKALSSIKMAIELDPQNMWYKLFLADVYDKAEKFDGSAEIYEQMIARYPDVEYHYFKHAYFLVKDGKVEEALKVYTKLEKKFNVNEEVTRRKHSLYMGLGDKKAAAKELKNLIANYPNQIRYYHLLSDFYVANDMQDEANEVYKKILSMDPEDAKANLAIAGEGAREGNETNYLASLTPVFNQKGEDIDIKIKALLPYITKVSASKDDAFINQALELGEILTQVHPDEAKAHSVFGDLLLQVGRNEEALDQYKKTISIDPSVFTVWDQILYILAESYDMQQMKELSEQAMDIFPNKGKLYYFNGIANQELNDNKSASDSFEQALMMSGRNLNLKADILARLSRTYAAQKKIEKAQSKVDKALEISPDDFRVQEAQAYVFYKAADYGKAKEWFEKSLKNGGEENFEVVEHYGDLLFQMKEEGKALDQWIKSKSLGGKSERLNKKISSKQLME